MAARLLQTHSTQGALCRIASVLAESSGSGRTIARVAFGNKRSYSSGVGAFLTTTRESQKNATCYAAHVRAYSTTTSSAITNATEGFGGSGSSTGAETLWGVPEVLMAAMVGVGTTSIAVSGKVDSGEEKAIDESSCKYGPTVGPLPSSSDELVATSTAAPFEDSCGWDTSIRSINTASGSKWRQRLSVKKSRSTSGHNASVGALQGLRPFMEDEYCIGDNGRFVAVFDGHGGSGVSSLLRDNLYASFSKFLQQSNEKKPSVASRVKALRAAFDEVGNEALKQDALQFQGSTAVAVVLHEEENGSRTLVAANVGDSRAVLSRSGRAIALTRDHKPSGDMERHRILSMGEKIRMDKNGGPPRVRNLAISRSIGDRFAKPVVTSDPEVKELPLAEDGDEFVVLASDGLWDVMSNQEVVSFVHNKLDNASKDAQSREAMKNQLSNQLAYEAIGRGTSDNVCVALVWLK